MTLPEKLVFERERIGWNQTQLGRLVGVSRRSISAYESAEAHPREKVLRALAQALDCSMEYLVNNEIDDPNHGKTREAQIDIARKRFGHRSAINAKKLFDHNSAFYAGGDMPQDDKDAFFEAVMSAYLKCKETARIKFGRKIA